MNGLSDKTILNLLERARKHPAVSAVLVRALRTMLDAASLTVHLKTQHIYGPTRLSLSADSCVVLCVVKDGAPYIDAFVEHYRHLGAKHIVFLDNGSTDGTLQRACAHSGVTVLACCIPFARNQVALKHYLYLRFAPHCWALSADIDEFFDFPCSDRLTLKLFLKYLDSHGYTAVATQMLDMFPAGELTESTTATDFDFRRLCSFCDLRSIAKTDYFMPCNGISNPRIKFHFGGIRKAALGADVFLTKHTLTRGSPRIARWNSHLLAGAAVADVSAVLYHYKFLPDFRLRVQQAVEQENHWNKSSEYKRYARALEEKELLTFAQPDSFELRSAWELVEQGFLDVTPTYLRFCDECARDPAVCRSGAPK